MKRACHALALDEERHSFHPELWDESEIQKGCTIEQVWFAGMHSNVGGGYPKQDLAMVTLDWMLGMLPELSFDEPFCEQIRCAANPHGHIYNSRSGAGVYYRFSPRDLEKICDREQVVLRSMRVHESAFERLGQRANLYHPGAIHPSAALPVEVVRPKGLRAGWQNAVDQTAAARSEARAKADAPIAERKDWHLTMVVLSLLLVTHFLWYYAAWAGWLVPIAAAAVLASIAVHHRHPDRRRPRQALIALLGAVAALAIGLFSRPELPGGADTSGILLPDVLSQWIRFGLADAPWFTVGSSSEW